MKPVHWHVMQPIKQFAHCSNGQWLPCFFYDLSDKLIYTPAPASFGEINDESFWFGTADTVDVSTPWTITKEQLTALIVDWIAAAPEFLQEPLSAIYPHGEIQYANRLFFSRPKSKETSQLPDERVLKLIGDIEDAATDEEDKRYLMDNLAIVGVHKIPDCDFMVKDYYECSSAIDGGQPVTVIQSGWVRDGRVLIPTKVEPA